MVTWQDIQTALTDFWNWLTQTTGEVTAKFTNTLGELGAWIYGGFKWIGDSFKEAWDNFTNWLYNGITWLANKIKEGYDSLAQWISGGLQWIGSGLSWIGQQLYSFGQWLWNGIVWIARTVASAIEGFINWIWQHIVDIWNDLVNFVKGWIKGINDYLNSWIKSLRDKLKHLILINTTLPSLFKSFDVLSEGRIKEGFLGMVVSPFLGAFATEIIDAIMPRPQSERIVFFPEFEFPSLSPIQIVIEKPEEPSTPPTTEIPKEPIQPPSIGYRPKVLYRNIAITKYTITVETQKPKTFEISKLNTISSHYNFNFENVSLIKQLNLVSNLYNINVIQPNNVVSYNTIGSHYKNVVVSNPTITVHNTINSNNIAGEYISIIKELKESKVGSADTTLYDKYIITNIKELKESKVASTNTGVSL